MPDNDPLRPNPDPFRPPEPQPYRSPDWNPAQSPPFEPPGQPNPVDPTRNPWRSVTAFVVAFALGGLVASAAYAAIGGGAGGMPWDTPLQNLRTDMTGPTATVLALVGFVLVMGILIFGGELNHFGRSLCFLILTASVLVGANNFLTGIGVAGATLDTDDGFNGFIGGVFYASLFWTVGLWIRKRRQARLDVRLGVATAR